jgi:hypothetical protein
MQKMGLHLTAEEIYSVNHSSIKDAIVMLNDGMCSASMISAEGLLLTNHHCAYSFIQAHSSIEKDYLKNGFWAMTKAEELKNDKLQATFLVRMEDVSQKVLAEVIPGMDETARAAKIKEMSAKIEAEATKGTFYTAQVKSFFEGNEFYLFVYETYKDIRLVGAPPQTIASFGDELDNWKWPRHACDFSLFRVYMSPEGEPAEYSKKNIPYKPKYFLPISTKGVKRDDFTMVMGYPGTTDRFMTSYGVKMLLEQTNPSIVKIRKEKLSLMKADMDASDELRIQYSSKYRRSDNYYKYYTGQIQVLTRLNTLQKKKEMEDNFVKWYNADEARKSTYGNVLADISKAYLDVQKYNLSITYFKEIIKRSSTEGGAEAIAYAQTFEDLYKLLKANTDPDKINTLTQNLNYNAKQYFKSYNLETDKKITKALLKMFYEDVPKDQLPDIFTLVIAKKYKNNVDDFVNDMFAKSIFVSKDLILDFLMKPDYKKLDKDLAYIAMVSFYNKFKELSEPSDNAKQQLEKANRLFVKGIREMEKDKKFYPNANSTMRFTYGKVTDYAPSPDNKFDYFTTIDELMAKVNPNLEDFTIPDHLKELYKNRDFGNYTDNGIMKICFITNNDVTGGVSGSPVINGNGELCGLVFDINWEATSVAIAFDPDLQRSINVDIRYMLFMIDKYAGASNIINELTINK